MVLSVQNNNPGNMRPVGKASGFQQFDTPQDGLNAMKRDLLAKVEGRSSAMKMNYGENYAPTLRNIISTWAPPSENDTGNYVSFVAKKAGIKPDQNLTSADVDKIMPAMIEMEGGKKASSYFDTKQYADSGQIMSDGAVQRTKTIQDVRSQYPQYNDLTDQQLGDALHKKFYSDIPINEFYAKVGIKPQTQRNNFRP